MALPSSTAALRIFVDANPEAWFSRLRDQALCSDLNQAKASIRNREILLVDLLQEQGDLPEGHYIISARTHPPFPRVLARVMFKDKFASWCLPDCGNVALSKEEKEEADLTKRFRAQIEDMSEYEMVSRIHEEGWIEEAGRAPVIVPGSQWQVGLRDEVDEALVSVVDMEIKFRQHYQEVLTRAKLSPWMVPLWKELEKTQEGIQKVKLLQGLLESLNRYLKNRSIIQTPLKALMIDLIKAYLSANVYLFWATADLFQLASSCLEIPGPNKEKMKSAGGRVLRQYVAAVLCAEKGSQVFDAREGGKGVIKTIKAGSRSSWERTGSSS